MGDGFGGRVRLVGRWSGASRRERLRQALELQRIRAGDDPGPTVVAYLESAERALERDDLNGGWEALFAAQGEEPFGWDGTMLALRADELRAEARTKLNDHWRGDAIAELLDWADRTPLDARRQGLARAMRLRNEHSSNTYRRLDTTRRQLELLAAIGLLVVVALTALLATGAIPLVGGDDASAELVVGVALFGALGGAFSGAISLLRATPKPIPQALVEGWTTLARPVVGAVGALAAFAFLAAGVLGDDGTTAAYAVAFAAGFSERLVSKAAESLGG